MSMKTLLWKDYRQNRKVLVGAGIIVAMPYLILSWSLPGRAPLASYFSAAAYFACILFVGMAAFIGGNAIAGERADRSAEFAAYLPIRRRDSLVSKAIVAVGMVFGFLAVNYGVVLISGGPSFPGLQALVLLTFSSAVLIFGVAWLSSSLTSSPSISAAIGIAGPVLLIANLAFVAELAPLLRPLVSVSVFFPLIFIVIGVAAFLVGSTCYLLGNEP
jgi:ABC-type transport system involved in multi-copper enzyme maturation permease subunit